MIVTQSEASTVRVWPPIAIPGRPRVLLVDDEPHALRLFSAFLSAAGMDVVAAESADRALGSSSAARSRRS